MAVDTCFDVKKVCQDPSFFAELIVSLRTAVVVDDWKLDKYQTSYDDILDAFRLACLNYEIPKTA